MQLVVPLCCKLLQLVVPLCGKGLQLVVPLCCKLLQGGDDVRILPVDVAGPLGVAPELGLYAGAALIRMCAEKLCTSLYMLH